MDSREIDVCTVLFSSKYTISVISITLKLTLILGGWYALVYGLLLLWLWLWLLLMGIKSNFSCAKYISKQQQQQQQQ